MVVKTVKMIVYRPGKSKIEMKVSPNIIIKRRPFMMKKKISKRPNKKAAGAT